MGTSGLGLDPTPLPAIANLAEQKVRAQAVVKNGASWFLTIAILSMVNTVLAISGAGLRFIFGLGIAQLVDAIAHQAGSPGIVLDLIINGFVAGIFVLFWQFARKAQPWAFWVGMALYALDLVITLLFHDYLAAAFHAYALYRIYMGTTGIPLVRSVEQAMVASGVPIEPK